MSATMFVEVESSKRLECGVRCQWDIGLGRGEGGGPVAGGEDTDIDIYGVVVDALR